MTAHVLTLNAGSSSLKFGLYRVVGVELAPVAKGQVARIGADAALQLEGIDTPLIDAGAAADHAGALRAALDALKQAAPRAEIAAVGHRIVHGGLDYAEPAPLDDAALAALDRLSPFAPLHQPHNLAGVRAARAAFPQAAQIGCFDTAFHRGHDFTADAFALPRRYYDQGVRRYGFHGLSYAYIAGALPRLAPELAEARVVVAHLGAGASMCAMRAGRSVSSTMGFSALDGLPMGTRCGQLDPGVMLYLMDQGMDVAALSDLLYRESGLKGLSGRTGDMRALLQAEADDPRAAQAVAYFVAHVRREMGALVAEMGGVDALVFTAGVGENAAAIRERVCDGLAWLGMRLDHAANDAVACAAEVGAPDSRIRVLVIPTDEEKVIACAAAAAIRASD